MHKNKIFDIQLSLSNVEHIQAGIFDINGIMRGKRFPITSYQKLIDNGMQIPFSAQNIDIFGGDIENSDFVFKTGDKDGTAMWQGAPLVVLNHLPRPVLLMPLSLRMSNGKPFDGCPRAFLKSVLNKASKKQLIFKIGIELEFCLFSQDNSSSIFSEPQLLSLLALDSVDQLFRDINHIIEQLDIKTESILSESGIGQIEIVFAPCNDLCHLADCILTLKHSLAAYALSKGVSVSFQAKPKKNLSGNGLHCHISIENFQSENVFVKNDYIFKSAIGSILSLLEPATLIFAPLSNSYNRFQENSHAPVNIGWGFDNRTLAIRIPNSLPEAKRIELRVAGADSNPYLLFAILVSAILDGINEFVEPPLPVSGNGYNANLNKLPSQLKTAIFQFEKSEKIRKYMPTTLRDMFLATKKQELRLAILGDFDG